LNSKPHPALLDSLAGLGNDPEVALPLFQQPLLSLSVDITSGRPRLVTPLSADVKAPLPLFAKLGAKSWRDGGSLRIIGTERPLVDAIAAMLASLTPHQHRYLTRVRPHTHQIALSFFAYRDFSNIGEVRWRVANGRAVSTSRCLRGEARAVGPDVEERMHALALNIGDVLGCNAIVDLAIEPTGKISILEINPPVTPGWAAAPEARSPSR
jgi:hypothetical protein